MNSYNMSLTHVAVLGMKIIVIKAFVLLHTTYLHGASKKFEYFYYYPLFQYSTTW